MTENHLRSALARGEFVHSAELVLPRDHAAPAAERFVADAAHGGPIRVISVTDLPGGNPALPPEAFVARIAEAGLTPLAHLTGKDGNRAQLEARLHTLARLGVENVLALTGDAQASGFEGPGKPVHDLDSVLILRLIEALRTGLTGRGHAAPAAGIGFDFLPGAVVNPYKPREPDQMMQLYKLELKLAAGARFIITQLGFNLRKLYELRQYMLREGLAHVPVVASVYVPTAKAARRMQAGGIPGCIAPDELVRRLETESKAQRLERAALLLAAVRELGFAGAHLGGFGLTHDDCLRILDRAAAIGSAWRERLDELVFPSAGEYYLLPPAADGLSDGTADYRLARARRPRLVERISRAVHRSLIAPGSPGDRFFRPRLTGAAGGARRRGVWYRALAASTAYRRLALGCVDCGDCIQDHLGYAGCSMGRCYKELRNGPCGGSRPDGSCEAHPDLPCLWGRVYVSARAASEDPRRFARVLVPPRDWRLNRTNALANRYADIDNLGHRAELSARADPLQSKRESTC